MKRGLLVVMVAVGVVGGLACLGAAVLMLFVFSIGTTVVPVRVEALVQERGSGRPVPRCLLAFDRSPTPGYGHDANRTDAEGRSSHSTSYSWVGSLLSTERERSPELRFYIGAPPQVGTFDEVESWGIRLRFREPWSGSGELVPRVEVSRSLAHEEVLNPPRGKQWRLAGFAPLPTEPSESLVRATVRLEKTSEGIAYRIPLTVFLSREQADRCQAP